MMKKKSPFNLLSCCIFVLIGLIVYYILLEDNPFNLSISAIISKSHELDLKEHLVVLGALPVYIAMVIFGTALLGLYLGSIAKYYLKQLSSIENPVEKIQ